MRLWIRHTAGHLVPLSKVALNKFEYSTADYETHENTEKHE